MLNDTCLTNLQIYALFLFVCLFVLPCTPLCLAASHHLLNWDPVSMTTSHRRGLPAGGRVYQSFAGIAARNLHTLHHALGGMEETDKNEHVCIYNYIYLHSCNSTFLEKITLIVGQGVFFSAWIAERGTVCVAESLIL